MAAKFKAIKHNKNGENTSLTQPRTSMKSRWNHILMLYLKPLWAWINDQHWWTKSTHGGVTLPPPSTSAFTVELLLDGFKGCWIIFSSGLQLLFLCFHAGSLCPSHGKLGVQMCQPYITGPPRRKIDLLLSDLRSKLGIQHWNLLVCSTKQGVLLPQTKSGTCRFVDQMGPTIAATQGSTTLSNWSCNCLRCCRGEALSVIQSARSLAIWLIIYFLLDEMLWTSKICIWCAVILQTSRYVQGYQPHPGTATRHRQNRLAIWGWRLHLSGSVALFLSVLQQISFITFPFHFSNGNLVMRIQSKSVYDFVCVYINI